MQKEIWILIHENRLNTFENKQIIKYLNNKNTNIKILDPKKIIIEYNNLNLIGSKEKKTQNISGEKFKNYETKISILETKVEKELKLLRVPSKKYFYATNNDIYELIRPNAVFSKFGCMMDEIDLNVLKSLESDGVHMINSIQGLIITQDKLQTIDKLYYNSIETINSTYVNAQNALNIVNSEVEINKYPLVIKSKVGSLGKGIYLIENKKELKNMIEQINLLDSKFEFLLQEYIPEGSVDYRVMILNGSIDYIIKRTAQNKEFRANYALGSNAEFIKTDEKIKKIADKIYKLLKMDVIGLDLFKVGEEYIVCEINSNPGYQAYNKITGVDYTSKLIQGLEKSLEKATRF